jgi:transcription termination/antitermination protein NusA
MVDLKILNAVLEQLEEERGVPKEKMLEAIGMSLATAYKKEYGKRGQIIRAKFDLNTGKTEFEQVKVVVEKDKVIIREESEEGEVKKDSFQNKTANKASDVEETEGELVYFNPEHHILLDDAKKIKRGVETGEEIVFPLEAKDDFSRIAAQTAKQVIIQKLREAEKVSVLGEYGKKEGEIVTGSVQRMERGNIFIDMGRATAILPFEEQIPGEKYKQGERVRAYLYLVEETPKGIFLKLSRSHPRFLEELFKIEAPEVANGIVTMKAIAREAGSRSKVAVYSSDEHIDPVGSLVGQRGVRVATVMSELGGEKIDIIEWSADPKRFLEDALSPAKILDVELNETEKKATIEVSADQQSLAIGKGGQNVRLAAKLTGWKIDIKSTIVKTEGENQEETI